MCTLPKIMMSLFTSDGTGDQKLSGLGYGIFDIICQSTAEKYAVLAKELTANEDLEFTEVCPGDPWKLQDDDSVRRQIAGTLQVHCS